jgi:hypothetical protein
MATLQCIHNDSHIEQVKGLAGTQDRKCSICGGSMKLMDRKNKPAASGDELSQSSLSPIRRARNVKPMKAMKKQGPRK